MSQTQVKTAAGDWDMSYFFPGYLGAEYEEACQAYRQGVARATLDAQAISALSLDTLPQVAAILHQWEELYQLGTKLGTYLGCLRAADGRDEKVAQEYAALQALGAEQKKLDVILLSLLKQAGEEAFQGLLDEPSLKSAAFRLERWRQMAQFQMAPDLETLAADLEIDGLSAWGRLYDQVSSRLEFDMPDGQGGVKKVPMALRRSLTESPDAAVRKAAHVNSNKSWAEVEDVCAACLNAIAGTRLTLYKKRNIPHFLTHPLFEAAISHKTLAAMFAAIRTRFELPREYLRLKAKIIGRPKLGAQDIYCPLPLNDDQRVSWSQAGKWLDQAYSQSYPAFSEFCRQALSRNWIDYQPRDGKRQGGFCTSPISEGESRIFMTFNETMGDVQTLAHELGHAFHNHVMRKERPLNLNYPMTLAETASTFAETLLTDAMLRSPDSSAALKLSLLATRLDHAVAFLLNIPSRFDFERQFYEERAQGEVSVSRIKEILLASQRACMGDVIDPDEEDAYFWASKLHFYITEVSFYNFPYSFGYLFSLGIYAQADKEGPDFYPRYEELLRRTGSDTAENIARQSLGVDLENPQFWLDSIAMVERDLRAFQIQAKAIFPHV